MKKFGPYYLILMLLVVAYVFLTFSIPPDEAALNRYGLSVTQARVISLTIVLPLIAIWYAAFYGFIKVKQYASLIKETRDGQALLIIGNGLMLMALSLPINSLLSILRNMVAERWPHWVPNTTIAYNYISLVMVLAGVWLVAHGARKLAGTLEKQPYSLNQAVLAVLFTAVSIFYAYATLSDNVRGGNDEALGDAAYHLPDFLIFATIVVPYIILWYLGLRAAYHIQLYRKNAPGVLYKNALGYLAAGVAASVLSIMALRLTASLSPYLSQLTLRFLLVVLYILLIVIGAGYIFIAIGAKKLKKIEEV